MILPLVSILVASYNSEKFISETIESVLSLTYSNFELIVCDDCSSDRTAQIVKSYMNKDARIQLYQNEINVGDYPNRNRAASYAKGKYIKYLDHDDTIYPWGLSAMVYCIEKYPTAAFAIIASNYVNYETSFPVLLSSEEAYRRHYFESNIFNLGPTGSIINRDLFESFNGFSGKPFVGDQELWLKLSRHGPVILMPNDLIWWREHDRQESRREKLNPNNEIERFKVNMDSLQHEGCPLKHIEKKQAIRNFKNVVFRRIILLYLLKFQIKKFYNLYKRYGLSFSDIIFVLHKNRIKIN